MGESLSNIGSIDGIGRKKDEKQNSKDHRKNYGNTRVFIDFTEIEERFIKSTIEVMRTSGNMDVIPIQVPEQIVQEIRDNVGGRITIFGEQILTMKRMEKEII